MHWKKLKKETGAVDIVEATIVFPIVIFVVILFIFLGNLFYQQAKVDAIAVRGAEYLARLYTHPTLLDNQTIPTDSTQVDIRPYRYLFGGGEAESKAKDFMTKELGKSGSGFFSGMGIHGGVKTCSIKNYVVYQMATVEIEYTVNLLPLKLFGGVPVVRSSCATAMSATDPAEFIRNVDMIMDYAEISKLTQKIKSTVGQFLGN